MHASADVSGAPGHLSCALLITAVRLALRVLGFGRTVALVRRLAAPAAQGRPDRRLAERVNRRVVAAAAFFPGRALCLEQSLALFLLLRRRGVPAELRLGVQPYPFSAHAWVELEGEPVNETPELIRQFVPFPAVVG